MFNLYNILIAYNSKKKKMGKKKLLCKFLKIK